MSIANGPSPHYESLKAVVFREDGLYVAQCLEHDISAQAPDLNTALDRLELVIDAECARTREISGQPFDGIAPAPNYFHALWEKGSHAITRVSVPVGALKIEAKLAA